MHYIKLLRPPEVEEGRAKGSRQPSLKIVLAITTDLGDAYLSPRDPIPLSVIGAYVEKKDGRERLVPVSLPLILPHGTISQDAPKWQAGMRVLKFSVALPLQPLKTVQIRPFSPQLTALSTGDICAAKQGLIMAAYSDVTQPGGLLAPSVCFRSLRLPVAGQLLQFEEDIGDSIARHIWDGGVVTVSLLADMCLESSGRTGRNILPAVRSILTDSSQGPLNILEIGCGIGVLGIGLARTLSLRHNAGTTRVLMTDLPEAEEKARANIARQIGAQGAGLVDLDFEPLDWEDGKNGVFGEKVQSRSWNLVVVSDCTYNTDTLLPLVKTFSAIRRHSASQSLGDNRPVETKIFLATKPRHSSERAFCKLMSDDGWITKEQAALPLPMLDGEQQSVELYLFEKMQS